MQPIGMMHTADQCTAIHNTSHLRQVLADLQSRYRTINRAELTADLCRPVRLHVVRVEVARTTIIEHDNTGLDGRLKSLRGIDLRSQTRLCPQKTSERKAQAATRRQLE